MSYRKKLIEVALPLDAISNASVREKSIRHGHPSTLHLWWSRKPLATCRAVLFASLVDDPSQHPDRFPTEEEQEGERERLFDLIKRLVLWENSNDEKLLSEVRAEILKSTDGNPPPFLDPFAGGGSIPLEAQRLGLEAHASDLNPVAVLMNKALIEIPPKFAGQPPVNPEARKSLVNGDWYGARGLADDIHYYGKWMRDEAERRIGHLYPKATLPKEYGEGEATVIAWLWVRTVPCSNPACGVQMPLTSKWWLSKKSGKETWIEPQIDHTTTPSTISFTVKTGQGKPQDGTVSRQGARCLACGVPVPFDYIRSEGKAGRMRQQLMAIVAEGQRGRLYLAPNREHIAAVAQAEPEWMPQAALPKNPRNFNTPIYGLDTFEKLFTPRQLVTLTTFSDLIQEVRSKVLFDAELTGFPLKEAYADAVATYLAIAIDRLADRNSTICSWDVTRDSTRNTFARQALPMVWDFAEANPLSESTGNFLGAIDWITEVVQQSPCSSLGEASQCDATMVSGRRQLLISTDPPYYDNIGYADLSDFFYVWLRRSLKSIYPELFSTMLVPKAQELVATPYRFNGSKSEAQHFFETGLQKAFEQMRALQNPEYPLTVYYAFKQAESEIESDEDARSKNGNAAKATASTGWETMLEGLIRAGFTITGTWPIHTEMVNRSVGLGTNALASSIVLVCRPRPENAPLATRRQFIKELEMKLVHALQIMRHEGIAPVDLAQASIGPGMEIYSKYSKVVEADGTPVSVRTALQLINRTLDQVLADQDGECDLETRWAIAWFETYAMGEGPYGQAETLSKAKNMTLQTLVDAGILEAKLGKVRLLRPDEYSENERWSPASSARLTAWEVMQRAIHGLDKHGEDGAAKILGPVGSLSSVVRDLAYRLYAICERKGWAQEALFYNMLIASWSGISDQARKLASVPQQASLNF